MAKVVTPSFRVSYPNVFKARLNQMNNQQEYSVVALFPKNTDLSKLKAAAEAAITEKWGPDKTKWPKNLRSPFRDQGEKKTDDGRMPEGYEEGAVYLNLKSSQRPQVVDQNLEPIVEEETFYPGCWARASINAYAYDQAGNRGVSFGLNNIQKVKDGDPLSGRTRAEDDFQPIAADEPAGSTDTNSLFS